MSLYPTKREKIVSKATVVVTSPVRAQRQTSLHVQQELGKDLKSRTPQSLTARARALARVSDASAGRARTPSGVFA